MFFFFYIHFSLDERHLDIIKHSSTYILSGPGRQIAKNGCQIAILFIVGNSIQNSNLMFIQ